MKKIGIFTDDFFPIKGGQGRHLFELYKRAYENDKRVIIFSPNSNNLKNHIQIFPENKLGRNLQFSFYLNKNINKLIKKYNLSTVHFHTGPGGIIIIKKPKAKMICTVHHTYYQQQKYILSQKWKYVLYLFEKKMYKNADKIIAVSEDTKKALIDYYKIPKSKITVIPNGVDFGRFRKIKEIKKISNSLLFVGRLDKRKGIDFLIKTIPLVKKEISNIKLFVIGKGKLRKKLEKFVKKNQLENNVEFLGFVPDEELPRWYNKCKITIVPSIFEGFGLTVLESLACGTPVIGTKTDGIRSIIEDKKFLVEYGNKKRLVRKIVEYLSNTKFIKINKKKYLGSRGKVKSLYEDE